MNLYGSVKRDSLSAARASGTETTTSPSMASPKPMEGLHDSTLSAPPPFLTKTYDIAEDSSTNHIISWSRGNNSFVVWDPQAFSLTLLPKYFKHNNFSSFVRQLNTYGFRKVDPDRWEFANEGFLRGQKHLLKGIRRRKNPTSPASYHGLDSCVEVGSFGLDGEIERLRRDKQVLMAELVKLRHQQLNTRSCIQVMEERLRKTETKQQHMMSFLARAMKNPAFMQQLAQEKDRRRELEETISKKRRRRRRRRIGEGHCDLGGVLGGTCLKIEPEEYGCVAELEAPDLDQIAMEMPEGQQMSPDEEPLLNRLENETSRLDDGFWEDLLGEQETNVVCADDIEDGEVDVLVEQLEFMGPNSPKSRF